MPVQVSYPGVYVEEISSGSHTITGVPTATTAFIGRSPKGSVDEPTEVTSLGDFERFFGALNFDYPLTYAVRDFFQNGGSHAIIIRRFKMNASTDASTDTKPKSDSSSVADSTSHSSNSKSSSSTKKGDK